MTRNGNLSPLAVTSSKARCAIALTWFSGLILLASLAVAGVATPEEPSDQYLRAFNLIAQADMLNKNNQPAQAKAKYQQAQVLLFVLKKTSPNWSPKAVAFRLNYVADKITALSPPSPPIAAESPIPAPSEPKSAALPAGTQIKLLEAGAEPRKALRLRPVAGQKQTVSITARIAMGAGEAMGGTIKMPPIKLTLGVVPKSVAGGGDINSETTVEDISVVDEPGAVPQMVEGLKAMMGSLKGMKLVATTAERGFVKKSELRVPPGTPAEAREMMEEMKTSFAEGEIIFPEEPVGAGAKWEVRQKVNEDGATIDQTSTYELVTVEGDLLTANASSEQRAANQKVADPINANAKADLVKLSGSGTAKVTVDLTKLMPTQGTAEERSERTIVTTMAGQRTTMTIKAETTTTIESK